MPWNYNDAEINGIIDSSLKDAPPAAPMSNTAASVRSLLKNMWVSMRTQVSSAVTAIDTVNANLVARSLNLNATVYVDGTTGNDANGGTWTTTALKTLKKVCELYSGKTQNLCIIINNTVEITENLTLGCLSVTFQMGPSGKLYFRKNATDNGNFCLNLDVLAAQFTTQSGGLGRIEAEGHSGNVAAESAAVFAGRNGCIRLLKNSFSAWRSNSKMQSVDCGVIDIVAGNNTTIFAGSEAGAQSGDLTKSSFFFRGSYVTTTLGTNSVFYIGFDGSKTFVRTYTPASSTDANVMDNEMVRDTNYLYSKQSGVIKKVAWAAF